MKTFFAVVGGVSLFLACLLGVDVCGWKTAAFFDDTIDQVSSVTFESQPYSDGVSNGLENRALYYTETNRPETAKVRLVAIRHLTVYSWEN